jgi:hypothetical protein
MPENHTINDSAAVYRPVEGSVTGAQAVQQVRRDKESVSPPISDLTKYSNVYQPVHPSLNWAKGNPPLTTHFGD